MRTSYVRFRDLLSHAADDPSIVIAMCVSEPSRGDARFRVELGGERIARHGR
jgi:hypothetical protein|tara:strand:+ start:9800 stop:9955 length:156 start_codon:yes stop_codon:yes gene_type:complete